MNGKDAPVRRPTFYERWQKRSAKNARRRTWFDRFCSRCRIPKARSKRRRGRDVALTTDRVKALLAPPVQREWTPAREDRRDAMKAETVLLVVRHPVVPVPLAPVTKVVARPIRDRSLVMSFAAPMALGAVMCGAMMLLLSGYIAIVAGGVVVPAWEFEWTELPVRDGAPVFYFSWSTGSNSNTGLTPEDPLKDWWTTINPMDYPGEGVHIRLKRGDTWPEPDPTVGGHRLILPSGFSAEFPSVVEPYGSGSVRPTLQDNQIASIGTPQHVAYTGLHLVKTAADGVYEKAADFLQTSDLLLEDLRIDASGGEAWSIGINIDGPDPTRAATAAVRGCVIRDCFKVEPTHSQGMLIAFIDGVLIEGCVAFHNGWSEDFEEQRNIFSHNFYIQFDTTDVTFRGNVTAQACSHGCQQRTGGLTAFNAFLNNPNHIVTGAISGGGGENSQIYGNLFQGSADINAGADPPAYAGKALSINESVVMGVYENVFSMNACPDGGGVGGSDPSVIGLAFNIAGLSVYSNVVYKWHIFLQFADSSTKSGSNAVYDNVVSDDDSTPALSGKSLVYEPNVPATFTYTTNRLFTTLASGSWFVVNGSNTNVAGFEAANTVVGGIYTEPTFPDPLRTAGSYNESLGGTKTLDAFLENAATALNKANHDTRYGAKALINYVRAGFGKAAV